MILMIDFPPYGWLPNLQKELAPEISTKQKEFGSRKYNKSMKKD